MFTYEKNEWDNGPSVIPRFEFQLQRYIRGISSFCNEKSLEETTAHLREDVFNHFPIINDRFEKEKASRIAGEVKVESQINNLQRQINELVEVNKKFREDTSDKGLE